MYSVTKISIWSKRQFKFFMAHKNIDFMYEIGNYH